MSGYLGEPGVVETDHWLVVHDEDGGISLLYFPGDEHQSQSAAMMVPLSVEHARELREALVLMFGTGGDD